MVNSGTTRIKNKSKNSPIKYGIKAIATFSKRTCAIVAAVK